MVELIPVVLGVFGFIGVSLAMLGWIHYFRRNKDERAYKCPWPYCQTKLGEPLRDRCFNPVEETCPGCEQKIKFREPNSYYGVIGGYTRQGPADE